ICLSEDTRRRMKLPNLRILLSKPFGTDQRGQILENLRKVSFNGSAAIPFLRRAQVETLPFATTTVHCASEQMPNPESRIGLGTTTDAFQSRTVTINWQPSSQDKLGAAAGHSLLGAEIGRAGFGRLWSSLSDDDVTWPRRMYGDQHNIGTTRMNVDRQAGVV